MFSLVKLVIFYWLVLAYSILTANIRQSLHDCHKHQIASVRTLLKIFSSLLHFFTVPSKFKFIHITMCSVISALSVRHALWAVPSKLTVDFLVVTWLIFLQNDKFVTQHTKTPRLSLLAQFSCAQKLETFFVNARV